MEVAAEWTQYYDETHQADYWYNNITGESQWEDPYSGAARRDSCHDGDGVHPGSMAATSSKKKSKKKTRSRKSSKSRSSSASDSMLIHMVSASHDNGDVYSNEQHHQQQYSDMDDDGDGLNADSLAIDEFFAASLAAFEARGALAGVEARREPEGTQEGELDEDEEGDGRTRMDYVALARQYPKERKYMNKTGSLKCVLCRSPECIDVLFPCEHRCLCRSCLRREGIVEDSKLQNDSKMDGFCNCPLCMSIIKKILPNENGKEVSDSHRAEYSSSYFIVHQRTLGPCP
jgi:hypothetical protein